MSDENIIIDEDDESYYQLLGSTYRNSLYCLNESGIEVYFSALLFNSDTKRIVYADNSFALRKRSQTQPLNNLTLPFMNYKVSNIEVDSKRKWFNFRANIDGIYVPEINRKLRMSPLNIKYDCTLWYHRDDDMQYAYQVLMYDQDVETKIKYLINIDGVDIEMIGVVTYNIELDSTYKEEDWLKKNKIHSIAVNFEIETFYIKDAPIYIPDSIIFEFRTVNGINDDISNTDIVNLIVDKYSETVTVE